MGKSRSAALAVAYLTSHADMTFWQAYDHVQKNRPIIHLNPGFIQQLLVWSKTKSSNVDICEIYPEFRFWIMARRAGVLSGSMSFTSCVNDSELELLRGSIHILWEGESRARAKEHVGVH